jgi:hypothetical protein
MRVTTADFIKHYGRLADRALSEPLTIRKNGHDRLGCPVGWGIRTAQAP